MELKVEFKNFDEFKKLNEKVFKQTYQRSIKRTVTKFKTTTTKRVRETYAIKAKDLKKTITLKKENDYKYKFVVKSPRIGLEKFGARQTKQGVSVRIRKDRGRKVIKGAFLAKDTTNKLRVFKRKYKERLPIDRFYSISVPQMFNKEIIQKGFKEAEQTFEKEFKHNLDYYLGKLK